MNLDTKLKKGYIRDLQKPNINKWERAKIIREVMRQENLNQTTFSKRYGFGRSQVQDWLLWDKITKEEYQKLKGQGLSDTDIYWILRGDQTQKVHPLGTRPINMDTVLSYTKLDLDLIAMTKTIIKYKTSSKMWSAHTPTLLDDLVKAINYLKLKMEKNGTGHIYSIV